MGNRLGIMFGDRWPYVKRIDSGGRAAAVSGLCPGCKLVQINETTAAGMSLRDAKTMVQTRPLTLVFEPAVEEGIPLQPPDEYDHSTALVAARAQGDAVLALVVEGHPMDALNGVYRKSTNQAAMKLNGCVIGQVEPTSVEVMSDLDWPHYMSTNGNCLKHFRRPMSYSGGFCAGWELRHGSETRRYPADGSHAADGESYIVTHAGPVPTGTTSWRCFVQRRWQQREVIVFELITEAHVAEREALMAAEQLRAETARWKATAIAAASACAQADAIIAIAVEGHPMKSLNGVYHLVAERHNGGWPRYKTAGGSHLYFHVEMQEWQLNNTLLADSECFSYVKVLEGPVPTGKSTWTCNPVCFGLQYDTAYGKQAGTMRDIDLQCDLILTSMETETDIEQHKARSKAAVAELAAVRRQKSLVGLQAAYARASGISQSLTSMPKLHSENVTRTQSGPPFPNIGISTKALRLFLQRFAEVDADATTSDVCHMVVKPLTVAAGWEDEVTVKDAAKGWYQHAYRESRSHSGPGKREQQAPPGTCSFCQLLHADPSTTHLVGPPSVFLSHAWSFKFHDVVGALEVWEQERQVYEVQSEDEAGLFVWFDVFCINQHASQDFTPEWWSTTFQDAIRDIGHTVMLLSPWDNPLPLTRAWCLWELFCTVQSGATFEVCFGPEEEADLRDAVLHKFESLLETFAQINVANAQAGSKEDQERILAAVRATPGGTAGLNKIATAQMVLQGVSLVRKLLYQDRPPRAKIIDSGVVPRLVEFLAVHANPQLQFQAAGALINIVSGNADHSAHVVDIGAVPIFVQLLSSPNDDMREQAMMALGNIAGESSQWRDMVLQSEPMVPILGQLTESSPVSMLQNGTFLLSNLCRGKPPPPFNMVSPALPCLARLIKVSNDQVLAQVCWALSYLSDGTHDKIQAVIEAGVVRRLVELLDHPAPRVQTPALRTVGNIVTGDDLQTQTVIDCGTLPCLLRLLSSHNKSLRKEACWTISNITAGKRDQIQNVIDCGLVPPLVQLLAMVHLDLKKEAAWAICNATSGGTAEQIRYLVTQQCIRPLCDLLTVQDDQIINVALKGIENILKLSEEDQEKSGAYMNNFSRLVKEADGIDKLETLQSHANDEVYGRSVKILETYFGLDVCSGPQQKSSTGCCSGARAVDKA